MISRLIVYLSEMFPISNFVGTMLTAVTLQLVALKLSGLPVYWDIKLLLPGIVLTCFSLLIRVMDEFKDYEDDLKNFPNRPLPSGRVLKSDLHVLGWMTVVTSIFFSATSIATIQMAFIVLIYSFLMLKWFFIEKTIRQSLPLALITHHPVVLLHSVYLLVSLMSWNPAFDWRQGCLILPLIFIFTNWEFSRKIRMPSEENNYTTYSKIWGPQRAILVAIVTQFLSQLTVFYILRQNHTPSIFIFVYYGIYSILMYPYWKFLFTLKLDGPLKKMAESQILFVIGGLLISVWI